MTETMRWRVVGYMVALFIGGAITGAAVIMHMGGTPQSLKLGRTESIAVAIGDKLDAKLNLTPEQQQKFAPLIKKASEELEASHLDCLKRISAAIDLLHAQILPDLTADQKEKLKQLEAQRIADMIAKYNFQLEPGKTNAP